MCLALIVDNVFNKWPLWEWVSTLKPCEYHHIVCFLLHVFANKLLTISNHRLVHSNNKGIVKDSQYNSLWGESTGYRYIPLTKVRFVMRSSWYGCHRKAYVDVSMCSSFANSVIEWHYANTNTTCQSRIWSIMLAPRGAVSPRLRMS